MAAPTAAQADDRLRGPGGVGDVIVHAIDRYRDAVAVVEGDRCVTYRQLGSDIQQSVAQWTRLGAVPGDRIAQISRNRYEMLVVIAAAYVGGFVSVPLLYSSEVDEHAYALRDSRPAILMVEEDGLSRAAAITQASGHGCVVLTHEALADGFGATSGRPLATALGAAGGHACARMVYTGGTTGQPKGVMNSAGALAFSSLLLASAHELDRDTSFLLCAPMSHGAGSFIVPVLSRGGRLVIHRAFDLVAVIEAFKQHLVNTTLLVPTMLYALLDHPRSQEIPAGAIRRLVYGAAPIAPARVRQAIERFGPVLSQSYGQTEVPSAITWLSPEDHARGDRWLASCGRPYPGVEVRLMAEGDLLPRRSGEVGEICVRAPHVMLGYWNRPDLTAEAAAGGWLHTGDLAYEDDEGYLFIVDRLTDLIISGGFNIYPSEVEAALRAHPDVADAALIGVPDQKWGEATHAFVVRRDGKSVEGVALQAFLRQRLGPVKTPKSIDFVATLPLTKVGKVDKKALRAPFWEGARRSVN